LSEKTLVYFKVEQTDGNGYKPQLRISGNPMRFELDTCATQV